MYREREKKKKRVCTGIMVKRTGCESHIPLRVLHDHDECSDTQHDDQHSEAEEHDW